MRRLVAPLLLGVLFGVGLGLSGMVLPEKVRGFLDVGGAWDPTLGFVMAGALGVFAPLRWWIERRRGAAAAATPARELAVASRPWDPRLLGGAALFGLGWGMVGFCPAPAIVVAGSGSLAGLSALFGMLLGLRLADAVPRAAIADTGPCAPASASPP